MFRVLVLLFLFFPSFSFAELVPDSCYYNETSGEGFPDVNCYFRINGGWASPNPSLTSLYNDYCIGPAAGTWELRTNAGGKGWPGLRLVYHSSGCNFTVWYEYAFYSGDLVEVDDPNEDPDCADCEPVFCPSKDDDGDGVYDQLSLGNICDYPDQCLNTPAGEEVDGSGCSATQRDSDGDGIKDAYDKCPFKFGLSAGGCPAFDCDTSLDSDQDGVPDFKEDCTIYDLCANSSLSSPVYDDGCSFEQRYSGPDNSTDLEDNSFNVENSTNSTIDLCEENPDCDCIPGSYYYKGFVDYDGLCCINYYKDATHQLFCDCQSGPCQSYNSSLATDVNVVNVSELAAAIAAENLKSLGKNLTSNEVKSLLNDFYNKQANSQADLVNHLNTEQHKRAESLKEQMVNNVNFLNNQQAARMSSLSEQLNSNHEDLKESLDEIVGSEGSYEDDTTGALEPHSFTSLLSEKSEQFSGRFDEFFNSVKGSDLFTVPFGVFNSLPSGAGQSAMNVSIGNWGGDEDNSVGFDFADYIVIFDVLRTVLLILTGYACFKILVIKYA